MIKTNKAQEDKQYTQDRWKLDTALTNPNAGLLHVSNALGQICKQNPAILPNLNYL